MKKLLFILLYMIVVQVKLVSQPVSCNLSIKENETVMQPYGLLNLCLISNLLDTTQEVWMFHSAFLEFRKSNTDWKILASVPNLRDVDGSDAKVLTHAPDTSFLFFDFYPELITTDDTSLFNGSIIQIRAKVNLSNSNSAYQIYSETISLNLTALSTEELGAINTIRERSDTIDCLMYLTSKRPQVNFQAFPLLNHIIQLYPNTVIGQHAKAAVALYLCKTGNENYVYDSVLQNELNAYLSQLSISNFENIRYVAKRLEKCIEKNY